MIVRFFPGCRSAAGFHISENQLQVLQITETIRKYSALSCGDVHRYDGKILEAIDTGQARILQSPDENTDEKEQFTSHITDDIGAKILVDATRHCGFLIISKKCLALLV